MKIVLFLSLLVSLPACGSDDTADSGFDARRRDVGSRDTTSRDRSLDMGGDPDVRDAARDTDAGPCAMSCDGCCDGEECFAGRTRSACGTEGAMCEACRAPIECEAGVCRPQPEDRWFLSVIAVSTDELNGNGGTYDDPGEGSLPDILFVINTSLGDVGASVPYEDTIATETDFQLPLARATRDWIGTEVTFQLYDVDTLTRELIAESSFVVLESDVAAASFDKVVLRNAAMGQAGAALTFRFRP